MNQSKKKTWIFEVLLIIAGTGLMALALNMIYEPMELVTGGFTGVGIIVKEFTRKFFEGGVPLWLTNFILNIPVFAIAIKVKGLRFIRNTLLATILLSVWLYVLPTRPMISDDLLLSAVFGGVIAGFGIGLVFAAKATTGGTDMVAAILQRHFRHYSIAQILQVVDGAVVLLGFWVFGMEHALYAVIAIFVATKVTDGLVEGVKFSKAAYIITDQHVLVAEAIMYKLGRGATSIPATGMYSGESRNLLFCVVSKKEIVYLKEMVVEADANAFIIVTDAREVLGEGFSYLESG